MRESARSLRLVPIAWLRIGAIIFFSCLTIIGTGACTRYGANSGAVQFVIEPADSTIAIRDVRFYVHEIELLDEQGDAVRFELIPDAVWQDETLALVDLSGGSEAERHDAVRGVAEKGGATYDGIRFVVGVPFERNHSDSLKAPAPLDKGDMFWSWQSGYKFLRVDLADTSGEWSFHLGSTGCASASAIRAPKKSCSQPNRLHVELRGFDPLSEPIRVHIDELVDSSRAPQAGACTGGYALEPACADVFAKTGLNPATGVCAGGLCRDQRIFGF